MIYPDPPLLWTVWLGSAAVWLGLSLIVVRRWKLPQKPAPWIILGVAVLVRLGYVFFMPVTLSDDIWRYVYDGQTLAAGINPYVTTPLEEIEDFESIEQPQAAEWLTWINNPELVTIYQPTSQWVVFTEESLDCLSQHTLQDRFIFCVVKKALFKKGSKRLLLKEE